ncbi:CidA/LrgA family protein [Vibrio sp. FNV 38]|nr:CidA/LrgA family protein [Vibrio sp. FNV 38]
MRSITISVLEYLRSFTIIGGALALGIGLQSLTGVSIPGSIFGMLILFLGLSSSVIPVDWVKPGASLFIRHMIFLFVPISVGLMVHFELLLENLVAIIASVVAGSAIVLVVMSYCIEKLVSKDN